MYVLIPPKFSHNLCSITISSCDYEWFHNLYFFSRFRLADAHHGYNTLQRQKSQKQEQPPPPPPKPLKAQENYNPKMRAWNPELSGAYNHNAYNVERFRGPGGHAGPEQYGRRAADSYHNATPSQMVFGSDLWSLCMSFACSLKVIWIINNNPLYMSESWIYIFHLNFMCG